VLTGAVVSLFDYEYNNMNTELPCDYSSFLYGNYFLVREDFDENQVIDDFKKHFRSYIGPTYLDKPKHFTILTTSKCNARCTYCYEQLIPNKRHMSEKVAMDIVEYIIKNANREEPISFEWFGGEPLYNYRIVDIISSNICSAGIDFTSNMISNGYLFDDDIIARAKSIWKL
jgi:sulfatase maturation enzyme AslB (radical SAM superfamily)